MFKKFSVFVLVLGFCVFSVKANAQMNNMYATVYGLFTLPAGLDLNPDITDAARTEYRLKNKMGYGGGAAFGYDFGGAPYSFSGELQFGYLMLKPDAIQQRSITAAATGAWAAVPGVTVPTESAGNNNSLILMAAGKFSYDYDMGMKPYLLFGAGMAQIKSTVLAQYATNADGSETATVPLFKADANSQYVFAYTAGLGMEYMMSPGVYLDISYRFFGTLSGADLTLSIAPDDAVNLSADGAAQSKDNIEAILRSTEAEAKIVSPKYMTHMIAIGARFSLQ